MNVRLMIKPNEVNAAGLVIIYVELTFRDLTKKLHTLRLKTGEKTTPEAWKGTGVTAKHGEGYKALNKRIQRKQGEVLEYISQNPTATLPQIKAHFTGKSKTQHLTFHDLFQQYITFKETTVQPDSLKPTRTVQKELKELVPAKSDLSGIGYDLFQEYYTHLHKNNLKPNTIITRLKKLRGFCNWLSDKGLIENTTYKKFPIGDFQEGKMVHLTFVELEALQNLNLTTNKRLDKVRDLLLFTCHTALRHSDSAKVRPHHIKGNSIQLYINKTKELHTVPLTGVSRSVLEKYSYDLSELKISNEKYNVYLKELGELANIKTKVTIPGIEKGMRVYKDVPKYLLMSSHIGRKTFCTLSLEIGMSEEVIMRVSGHKDRRSFQKYLNLTTTLKEKEMSLWDAATANGSNMKIAK